MTPDPDTFELVKCVVKAAEDKIAHDPVIIDVTQRMALADYFLVVSADNERQVRAIAEEIMDQVRLQLHRPPARIEGRLEGRWVLLDYQDVVVDVFLDAQREYYALEHLWGDVPVVHLEAEEWNGIRVLPKEAPADAFAPRGEGTFASVAHSVPVH